MKTIFSNQYRNKINKGLYTCSILQNKCICIANFTIQHRLSNQQKLQNIMEKFILRYSWFVLIYLFKPLGIDVLKKDGKGGLKQTSAFRFWFRWIFTNAVISSGIAITWFYILIVETNIEDFMEAMREKLYKPELNIYAVISNFTMIFGLTIIGIFKLRTLSGGLVGIQDYFKQNAMINEQATKKEMKIFFLFIFPNIAIIIIGCSLAWFAANLLIYSYLNVSTLSIIIFSTFCSLLIIFCCTPIWWFFFIYTEVNL